MRRELLLFSGGESHPPKNQMAIGNVGQETNATLIALPIKVLSARLRPANKGERNMSSKATMGKRTKRTNRVCFQTGGIFPVWKLMQTILQKVKSYGGFQVMQ